MYLIPAESKGVLRMNQYFRAYIQASVIHLKLYYLKNQ